MRAPDGATLSLVTYVDGKYGVLRNGELAGDIWPETELDACIQCLMRLAGKDGHLHA